jgi:hypothetical protein
MAASLEYACVQQLGMVAPSVMQESLKGCATWMTLARPGGETVCELLPWNAESRDAILSGFRVRMQSHRKLDCEKRAFSALGAYLDANFVAALLSAERFAGESLRHTAVLLYASSDHVRLVIPRPPGADGAPPEVAWADYPLDELASWGASITLLRANV